MAPSVERRRLALLLLVLPPLLLGAAPAAEASGVPSQWRHRGGLAYTMLIHAQIALADGAGPAPGGGAGSGANAGGDAQVLVDAAGSALACFDAQGVISYTTLLQGPAGPAFQLACASNSAAAPGITLKVRAWGEQTAQGKGRRGGWPQHHHTAARTG